MRSSDPSRLFVYCGDYECAHSVVIGAVRWPDRVILSNPEPLFVCQACGHRGAQPEKIFDNATSGLFIVASSAPGRLTCRDFKDPTTEIPTSPSEDTPLLRRCALWALLRTFCS